jgi:hypothetical protein
VVTVTDDLLKRAEPFLIQCSTCELGLPYACNCPTGDFRPVMLDLICEVERLRREHEPRRGSDVEAWIKWHRDRNPKGSDCSHGWYVLDDLLDSYREHSDTGTPLSAAVVGPHPEGA